MNLGSNVMRKGCLVGLASVGHHSWLFTRDLMHEARPLNYFYNYLWIVGRPIAEAYNIIFDYAQENDFEYIFLKEEDTIAPPESWTRLFNKLQYNPQITAVTGVYPRKSGGDPTPFFYRGNGRGAYLDWKWGEFFEVTGIPFGCTMIRTDDLKKLDKLVDEVWVENYPEPGKRKQVKAYCRMVTPLIDPDGNMIHLMSQDLYFSEKCQEAGLKLYVDASVECTHFDLSSNTEYVIPHYLHDQTMPKTDKLAANIGCGSDFNLVHGVKPLRVDIRDEVKPDLRMDLRDMSGMQSEQFDYVKCFHTLEHFTDAEARQILRELVRIVKPGGELFIAVPDIVWAMDKLKQGMDEPLTWWTIYGAQDADWNRHKTGFTPEKIEQWLAEEGLTGAILRMNEETTATIYVRAFKPPLPEWFKDWQRIDKSNWDSGLFFNSEKLDVPDNYEETGWFSQALIPARLKAAEEAEKAEKDEGSVPDSGN